jgi:tRNA A-37 threonylcarbamoyl transferase component Bud32
MEDLLPGLLPNREHPVEAYYPKSHARHPLDACAIGARDHVSFPGCLGEKHRTTRNCVTILYTGTFSAGTYDEVRDSVPIQFSMEPDYSARSKRDQDIEHNLKRFGPPLADKADENKGNALPQEKSNGVQKALENVDNQRQNDSQGTQQELLNQEIPTMDEAKMKVMGPVLFTGINRKLGGFPSMQPHVSVAAVVHTQATTTDPQVAIPTIPTESPPHDTSAATATSRSISSNQNPGAPTSSPKSPHSAAAVPGNMSTVSKPASKSSQGKDYVHLPNSTVYPTGVILGQGAYGDVVEVEYKNKIYAAKKYRLSEAKAKSMLGAFCREQDILAQIRHPHIVPYYGVCKLAPDNSTVIVMERMETNLTDFLKENDIGLPVKYKLLYGIACGLDHLHSQTPAIIHRDLTAGNVLLNSNGIAKISDFGNSRMVDLAATPELLTSSPGTLDYMAPEALEGCEYNDKLDIFSYGHLAIHIIIQRRPHPLLRHNHKVGGKLTPRTEVQRREKYLNDVKVKLDNGNLHPLYHFIIKCLDDEPAIRPSCTDALECIQKLL